MTVINILITQISYTFVLLPILGKAVRLPISVVLIGVLVGFALGSLLFAFLAVPLLATLRVLVGYVLAKSNCASPSPRIRWWPRPNAADGPVHIDSLAFPWWDFRSSRLKDRDTWVTQLGSQVQESTL